MSRIRFSIGSLLVVVLIVAVVFAALRESNDLWDSGVFTATLAALLISILLVVHRTEDKRAFWIGFALCGWSYLGLSLVPSVESRLLTTKLLAYLDSKVPGRSLGVFSSQLSATGSATPNNQFQSLTFNADGTQLITTRQGKVMLWDAATGKVLGGWTGTTENLVKIGHSLFALMAGWLGGQLSRRLCRTSRTIDVSTQADIEATSQ
jgi:hypothetical protein